jgi:hypothetical protein
MKLKYILEKHANRIITTATITIVSLLFALLIGILLYSEIQKNELKSKQSIAFIDTIPYLLENGHESTLKDVKDVYTSYFIPVLQRSIDLQHMSNLLKSVKTGLYRKESKNLPERSGNITKLNSYISLLDDEIIKLNTLKPFQNIPSPEGELLEDIYVNFGNLNSEYLKEKLDKLGTAVKARQETVLALSDENQTSLKFSIGGLIGTVSFGLISVFLSIWLYRKSKTKEPNLEVLRKIPLEDRLYGVSDEQLLEAIGLDKIQNLGIGK